MKKILLILLLLSNQLLFGQITINSSNLPTAGQTWIEASDEFYNANITPGGANQTWNYTGLLTTTIDTTILLTSASTPYGASDYPASNLAIHQAEDSTYLYITSSASGFYLDGYYFYNAQPPFGQNKFAFSPTYRFVPTPFTYLDNYLSTYKYVIDIDTALPYIRFVHQVNVNFLCDGYGALQLPGVTHPNTLRIKQTETSIDSLLADTAGNGNYFSFSPPTVEQTTSYRWFKATQPSIVLTLEADSAGTQCNRSTYMYNFITSVTETPFIEVKVSVFPNPTSNLVHVLLPQEGSQKDVFQLCDINGKVIRETSLKGMKQYSFYVNNLQSGVYMWTVNSLNTSGKLVVE
ncbi:MAG: T9SS type A sorting domain-containing protein [Bacteroidetes bacterium]|nr:T9SS type A sorting domain-containing protein [Bacteroidota bacterium]